MSRSNVVMHPAEQKRQARKKLVKVANKLSWALDQVIAALDELDGDPDLEPDLGSLIDLRNDQRQWAGGANDNREDDCDLEFTGDEFEPHDHDRGENQPHHDDQTDWHKC